MTPDIQPWREALAQEYACAGSLLSLIEAQQTLVISRQFDALAQNYIAQEKAITALFQAERRRVETQRQLAQACNAQAPGRRKDIYPHLDRSSCEQIEALVIQLQNTMAANQRKFQQNQLLLSRSIELAQQVLQRSGAMATGRTYGSRGKEKAFALTNTLSRWEAVV